MLLFLLSFLPFLILLSKSISLQPLPSWATETRLLSLLFLKEITRGRLYLSLATLRIPHGMLGKRKVVEEHHNVEETPTAPIFDLPALALDNVLDRLSPAGLCNMARVCSSFRHSCRSDHLWRRHMREKWGRVIGEAARREWLRSVNVASPSRRSECLDDGKIGNWIGTLFSKWPLSWLRSTVGGDKKKLKSYSSPLDSIMSWYLSLESGDLWFPAQVYNREKGHVGFMLSCYDAELSYDWKTDTFRARYPSHGRRTLVVEDEIPWDRVRAPPVDASAHELHVSDCLDGLHPGDHIEMQWRRNKDFPYGMIIFHSSRMESGLLSGFSSCPFSCWSNFTPSLLNVGWWYGAVGHLETCDGSELHCRCHNSDTLVLEFKQFVVGSRWRRATINRKDHQEEGDETYGFYGGIRMLESKEEIDRWKQFWPAEMLE